MIIETDCGHDPDDFFTICYLVATGVNVEAILITPGDLDQIAIVRLICDELGLDIPIGVSKTSEKLSSGGMHHDLLKKYKRSFTEKADGFGVDLLDEMMKKDTECFIIGPPKNMGQYLVRRPQAQFAKCTMQGGFLSYSLHEHASVRLEKFEGQDWVPTFNMNGDVKGTQAICGANIGERRFCGKNVCHTVICTTEHYYKMSPAPSRAAELFMEGMKFLFTHRGDKKFHDPVAAVCHLHPEVGTWVKGKPERMKSGWGTRLCDDGDYILADLNYDRFWEYLQTWK